MITLINDKTQMLSKLCLNQKGMTYGKFMSLLKKKNIKINGQKTNKDIIINSHDQVTIYGFDTIKKNGHDDLIFYQDNNIVIINKPKGIQVKREDVNDNKLCIEDYFNAKCVHRLDRNTSGLLILAKNKETENELINAFKNHNIEKYYKVLCYGQFDKQHEILRGYLTKNAQTKLSTISKLKTEGSVEVLTEYNVLKSFGGVTMLEVKLITGKTHQIRAHFMSIHHSVVGDRKYQNKEYILANKQIEKVIKNQCLIAYKIKFNLDKNSKLSYLNDKEFILNDNFEKEFKLLGM